MKAFWIIFILIACQKALETISPSYSTKSYEIGCKIGKAARNFFIKKEDAQ